MQYPGNPAYSYFKTPFQQLWVQHAPNTHAQAPCATNVCGYAPPRHATITQTTAPRKKSKNSAGNRWPAAPRTAPPHRLGTHRTARTAAPRTPRTPRHGAPRRPKTKQTTLSVGDPRKEASKTCISFVLVDACVGGREKEEAEERRE